MGEILVGTCSWTDSTLIESHRFYPAWAKSAEARLQYYASQFNLVEVDSSYYALPIEKTGRLWVERRFCSAPRVVVCCLPSADGTMVQ